MTLAERVLGRLRAAPASVSTGEHVAASASIGVAGFPFHAADERELLLAADCAMYEAKNAGGCRVRLAVPNAQWIVATTLVIGAVAEVNRALGSPRQLATCDQANTPQNQEFIAL